MLKNFFKIHSCTGISDEGFSILREGFSALRHITFDFLWYRGNYTTNLYQKIRCKELTDEGLLNLTQGFKRLNSLEHMTLNVGG